MRRAAAAPLALLGVALAAAGETPERGRYPSTVAGGEITIDFGEPIDSLSADVGPTPTACALDETGKQATCRVPATLGPGLWPVDVELTRDGSRRMIREIIELRVPAIVSVEPRYVRGGRWIELALEAPLPNGEPVELWIRGTGFEHSVKPQQLRPSRLRARLPSDLPASPTLRLRVRDQESEPFAGLVSNAWVSFALGYLEWLAPGLLIGGVVAIGIALRRPPEKPRPRGPAL
jgi:hypothetical protein